LWGSDGALRYAYKESYYAEGQPCENFDRTEFQVDCVLALLEGSITNDGTPLDFSPYNYTENTQSLW